MPQQHIRLAKSHGGLPDVAALPVLELGQHLGKIPVDDPAGPAQVLLLQAVLGVDQAIEGHLCGGVAIGNVPGGGDAAVRCGKDAQGFARAVAGHVGLFLGDAHPVAHFLQDHPFRVGGVGNQGGGDLDQLGHSVGLELPTAIGQGGLLGSLVHLPLPFRVRGLGLAIGVTQGLGRANAAHVAADLPHPQDVVQTLDQLVPKFHGRGQAARLAVVAQLHSVFDLPQLPQAVHVPREGLDKQAFLALGPPGLPGLPHEPVPLILALFCLDAGGQLVKFPFQVPVGIPVGALHGLIQILVL